MKSWVLLRGAALSFWSGGIILAANPSSNEAQPVDLSKGFEVAASEPATQPAPPAPPPLPPLPPPPQVRTGAVPERPMLASPAGPGRFPPPLTSIGARSMYTNQIYSPQHPEQAFAWDALIKEYTAPTGEVTARFHFSLTNMTNVTVTITSVRTSCGCTVAKLPQLPWPIPPGSNGTFEATVDLRGKSGLLTKTVTLESTAGYRYLTLRISVPVVPVSFTMADRARNMQIAMADRQAVFRGDCVQCHVQPGLGKQGEALYQAVCGVCHEAVHRASMVPNLHALNKPTDRDYWGNIVTKGKSNSLMPGFAASEGGPLTDDQIKSLVDYLSGPFQARAGAKPFPSPAALK